MLKEQVLRVGPSNIPIEHVQLPACVQQCQKCCTLHRRTVAEVAASLRRYMRAIALSSEIKIEG